jgi:APA family basic amino acid/polyamine antiporter
VTVVEEGALTWAAPIVRVGAAVASLGVLLSLLAGVGRTTFAMASERDLPPVLAAVEARHRVPRTAQLVIAAAVIAVVLAADVRGAIGFSSFAVLFYYAVANASAWTLAGTERRWPRAFCAIGLVGCAALSLSLPATSVLVGAGVVGLGAVAWAISSKGR